MLADFFHRLRLNLPDAFARDTELVAHLLKGVSNAVF